jgi:hypothetical protein
MLLDKKSNPTVRTNGWPYVWRHQNDAWKTELIAVTDAGMWDVHNSLYLYDGFITCNLYYYLESSRKR